MKQKRTKIIIVGAGIAGIAAGGVLTKSGFDVKILEARHRYGGRISVDHSLGVPLGRGAGWMHGNDRNPIKELARKYGAKLFPINFEKFYSFDRDGNVISYKQVEEFNQRFEIIIEHARKLALQKKSDLPLASILSSLIQTDSLSILEQDLFERKLKFFENYMGAEYELLSARYWDEEETLPGGHALVEDAYESILSGLASESSIQLNTIVEAISERKNDIEVLTNQGLFHADAIIVTLPLGVLKKQIVKFEPALSMEKQGAINRLGMGLFDIVAMKFPYFFWPKESHAFFLAGSQTCSMFVNFGHFSDKPILLGYVGGKAGRLLEAQQDEEILEGIMLSLRHTFGDGVVFPEKYFITRWLQDPWSFGSYSYLPVGATENDRDLLAAPESNRLFFAGEATYKGFSATVHGAYLSGLREAERIKRIFNAD